MSNVETRGKSGAATTSERTCHDADVPRRGAWLLVERGKAADAQEVEARLRQKELQLEREEVAHAVLFANLAQHAVAFEAPQVVADRTHVLAGVETTSRDANDLLISCLHDFH